jgi:S1-C subfamily serine protease
MGTWNDLSNELSQAIQAVGKSIVTVQAGGGRTASGIVLDEKTVVTSARAVSDEGAIRLWISPDEPFDASLVGRDSGTDIAVLKTDAKLAPSGAFAETPQLAVGQLVLAIGRTWRGNLVASSGILSGVMGEWHTFRGQKIDAFIRPDLTLYSGFSGGALIGADQKIIGMSTTALRRESQLAIPHSTIQRTSAILIEKGHIPKPYLGLGLQPVRVSESLRKNLNLSQHVGALVVHVESGSPAESGGVLLGDILLQVEGHNFGEEGAASVVFRLVPDQKARILGIRGGKQFSSTVSVTERPGRQA